MIKVFTDFPALLRKKVGARVEGKTATGDPIFTSNPRFLYECLALGSDDFMQDSFDWRIRCG